jgi:hypothetical protein
LNIRQKFWFALAVVSGLNGISLWVLSAWPMATLWLFLMLVFKNLSSQVQIPYLKKVAAASIVVVMIGLSPFTLNQLTSGLHNIGDQAISGTPDSLSYPTRFGLWWSAVWMSIGGVFYGAPYTVAEQVLMFWPGDKERLWDDDFPTKAKKVRALVSAAKKSAGGKAASYKYDLLWRSYCEDNCDVGLALNGGDLTVDILDGGQRCTATARVSVSYKPQYRGSTILGYGKYRLRIDQAAYWSLQELGWLFPFTLRYRWKC